MQKIDEMKFFLAEFRPTLALLEVQQHAIKGIECRNTAVLLSRK
jgi:hypothetical protein